MAGVMKCNLCGYVTVRSGMANHIRLSHPSEYANKPFSEDWATIIDNMTCAELRALKKQI